MARSGTFCKLFKAALFTTAATLALSSASVGQAESRGEQFQRISLQSLKSTCRLQTTRDCNVVVDRPISTDLEGTQRLPGNMHVRFGADGAWQLSDGTLDFNGSELIAPPAKQIFSGDGVVKGLRASRPEWFTSPVKGELPAEALWWAYNATVPWGTIWLRDAAYVSPFFDPNTGSCGARQWSSPRTLVGTRRPLPDSETDPTRLENGTVIRGSICGTGVLRAAHLGVDVGPHVIAADFAGKAALGIMIANDGPLGWKAGSALEDVSVLTTGLKDQHSVLLDGQRMASVQDLWIWTLGGTHGLVMKSFDSSVRNLHCAGASADCLILKSDYVTDHAGQASNDIVDGVYLHYLKRPGDTGGIYLDARWDSLKHLRLSHIREEGLSFGIEGIDSIFHSLRDVSVSDWNAFGLTGSCLKLTGTSGFHVENYHCSQDASLPPIVRSRPRVFVKANLRTLYTQMVTNLHSLSKTTLWFTTTTLLSIFVLIRSQRFKHTQTECLPTEAHVGS